MWDTLWINARVATMAGAAAEPLGSIDEAALAVQDGRIAWLGPEAELDGAPGELARRVEDAGGGWLLPGFVDCHTHLLFGGHRAAEFAERLAGVSYEELAQRGGGIRATVEATTAASAEDLVGAALRRLDAFTAGGVTTVEVKSGYGLTVDAEIRLLETMQALADRTDLRIYRTYLALHALPPEFAGRREAYLDSVCNGALSALAADGLADAVDAYCDTVAFTEAEVARLFDAAAGHGLALKLHADQLSDSGGAALAAGFGALSADHLEYTSPAGVERMAEHGTVAVLLPAAFYTLRQTQPPPVAALREHAVPIALGSDLNPGTSPLLAPVLTLNMACTLFGLTPAEALLGMTVNGARALGLAADIGTLETGKQADMCLWDIDDPAELSYWIGHPGPDRVMVGGREVGAA
ncbi:MAG: imidazolonepropionase [Pseudomonadota bacterium]